MRVRVHDSTSSHYPRPRDQRTAVSTAEPKMDRSAGSPGPRTRHVRYTFVTPKSFVSDRPDPATKGAPKFMPSGFFIAGTRLRAVLFLARENVEALERGGLMKKQNLPACKFVFIIFSSLKRKIITLRV